MTGIIVVFGRRGFGKTTWIKYFIFENPNQRYLIMDHFHEYDVDEHSCVITSLEELEYLEFSPYDNVNKIIFRGEVEFDSIFATACEMQNVVVVFDEIDMVCSPYGIDDNLNRIIQYGRHLNVGLIGASRRPANVHRNLTSQAMEIICFNIQEPRDLKYIADFCGENIANNLPNLKVGEFMKFPTDKNGEKAE